jgi:hypothetical protein
MHGMVLKPADVDYSDLKEYGRITIEYGSRGARVTVDGFEFAHAGTCRQHGAKAMAWARDVLAIEVEANRLIPGGHLLSCSGMSHGELEAEAERVERET